MPRCKDTSGCECLSCRARERQRRRDDRISGYQGARGALVRRFAVVQIHRPLKPPAPLRFDESEDE